MSVSSWPNRVTMLRIMLIAPFVVALLHLQDPDWRDWSRWSALMIFAIMAASDGLDGYLARRLKSETLLGRFLDPLADKLLISVSVVLLARPSVNLEGLRLPPTVAVIAIGKDLIIVMGFCIVYFITSRIYIDCRWTGKSCTVFQLSAVVALLLWPDLPDTLGWVPPLLWWGASVLAVVAVLHYFQMALNFIGRHEAHPPRKPPDVASPPPAS